MIKHCLAGNNASFPPNSYRPEKGQADLQPLSDAGTGERVPVQPLPDPQAAHRSVSRTGPHREAGQDLVSEQAHEVEKRTQQRQVSLQQNGARGN